MARSQLVLLVALGLLIWTLTEYWLHRLVFHWEPDHPLGSRLHFIIHGVHHDHPNDRLRLVMPPAASLPLAALFLGAFTLIFGTPAAYPIFAGLIVGYLAYDYTHYHLHHHTPRTKLGKRLREQHMRHHFQDHRYGYGVSSPLWDVVFRTLPRKRSSSSSRRVGRHWFAGHIRSVMHTVTVRAAHTVTKARKGITHQNGYRRSRSSQQSCSRPGFASWRESSRSCNALCPASRTDARDVVAPAGREDRARPRARPPARGGAGAEPAPIRR